MERPIRDIQQHIDYVGTLAEEEPDPKTRWQLQKRVAASVWQRDAKAYYEEQGAEFFDFGQWQLDQAYASYLYHESIKRYRKRQGDRQILARLDELNNVPREDGGYKVTGARRKVIRAIVGLATSSGVLYCWRVRRAYRRGRRTRSARSSSAWASSSASARGAGPRTDRVNRTSTS